MRDMLGGSALAARVSGVGVVDVGNVADGWVVVVAEGGKGRRGSRSGDSRRSAEEEFLDSLSREPRMSSQAGPVPSSHESPTSQTPKSSGSGESESPVKGSFMRGFGRSRAGESQGEGSPGEGGSSGATGSSRLNVESNHRATTSAASSSVSMDGSEAESVERADSSAGFTISASNGSAFPDLNEPYGPSSKDLPTRRLSQLKVSGEEAADSSERFAQSPRTPAPGMANAAKDSPSSGPGPFGPSEGGSHASSQGESQGASVEEGTVPARRAFDLNSTESPTGSPSFGQRSRRSGRGDASRPNGPSSSIEEPLTKFEVNLSAGAAASRRGRRKSDLLGEVTWLTVDQIRLVTKPSTYPAPSRPPPPLPPLGRQYSGSERHRSSQKSGAGPETPKHQGSGRSQSSEAEKQQQQSSPRSESSGGDRVQSREKVSARVEAERGKHGSESRANANGGVQMQGEGQKAGYVLPEVTVVELGTEIKPSREERERMRAQIDRAARRAKREEERLKEKEQRLQREGQRESMFNDTEGREPSRSRTGRDKVFYPKERVGQDPAGRREDEIQYRAQRQQAKELQERLARQEEARDRERESERSGDRLRRSAEKAQLEARERAEREAVERAVQEAHERAERAARQRAAAAREKERKEKERERERDRDREKQEEEKLRDRVREKERGLAEQIRSRDGFRATSEPRQRPSVSGVNAGSGLSRFSSGGNLNKFSGGPAADTSGRGKSPSGQKASEDWPNLYGTGSGSSGTDLKFQEIPGEPADRRKLRLEKQMLIEERAAKALQEKNMRDLALQREQEERQRFASTLDADVRRWSVGKEGNLRALLSTLHMMLWPECNWKIVSMTDLVSAPAVKKAYQRAILCVHPDKVQQKGASVKQKYIAEKVFDLLKDAYAKFNSELY